ncbi:MAG: Ig-like domain-containing protein [Candidatus Methanoperedens sp.]
MSNLKSILILIAISLLSIASPANAYTWNDFPVNNPIVDGNTIIDHNNFVYSSTADGIYNINYGNGKSTYFGFALSGTASGTNFVKFTSDYTWTQSVSQTGDNIDVRATNNGNNWITDFAFTPYSTKITNTLTNTLPVSITNAKFYYVFTVNQGDTILYNNVNYTIQSTPNIHISGNLNNNLPSLKINNNMLFDYQDIIDNGFSVTDLYIKPTSSLLGVNYAGNVAAIGFTKNGGVFPAGSTVTIDPTITNGNFSSGTTGWTFSGNGNKSVVSGRMRVNITAPDTANQLYQYDLSLSPDTYYHFEAVMNSTSGHNIDVNLFQHVSPYTNYGLDWNNININTSLTRYETNFTTSGFSSPVNDARLQFYFGLMGYANENYYFDNITLEKLYLAPVPITLAASQGNFWINHTWTNGTGSITDSYNVSQNGTWINGTNPYLNTTVLPHGWSNITVYAYNSTGYTNLSSPVSLNTQLDNNPAVIGNISATYTIPIGGLLQIIPSALDLDSDPLTFASNANKGNFTSSNGSLSWTPQAGDNGTYNWHINVSDSNGSTDTFNFSVSVNSNTPGQPLDITASTGNFWINHSWTTSVNTDSFNVSVNGVWVNGSSTNFNNTTVLPHGYSNITVYGYNLTSDTLGNGTSLNSQIPNNNPTIESLSISAASITTAQSLLITAINASDLDGDNVTIMNVSVLFNLGSTTNYSMTNTVNTSNWTYLYSSGTAGSYTITGFYVSDNDTASNVFIAASQAFTVTTPTISGSSGSSGSSGTTTNNTINNTIIVGKTPLAPPTVTLNTISNTETGLTVLWVFLGLSIIWFLIVFTTPNKSVLGLIAPVILMAIFTRLLELW